MQTLPQELVDKIIDELACFEYYRNMAQYSLISRIWVTRTQRHCFKQIDLEGMEKLEKWQRNIEPDSAGVSRHVRELTLAHITSLEGFEAHIRAFTCVELLQIIGCSFVMSPLVAECFAPMGSSLARLWIFDVEATSGAITSLLAALPKLKRLNVGEIKTKDDTGGADLTVRVPFFEGGGSVKFNNCDLDQRAPPDWIPPSTRFGNLEIATVYLLHKGELVNQWLSNSSTNLTCLAIYGNLFGKL